MGHRRKKRSSSRQAAAEVLDAPRRPLPHGPRGCGDFIGLRRTLTFDRASSLAGRGTRDVRTRQRKIEAPASVCAALSALVSRVIVVMPAAVVGGRPDALDEEPIVRAISTCPVPVVVAVGHETDVSISDRGRREQNSHGRGRSRRPPSRNRASRHGRGRSHLLSAAQSVIRAQRETLQSRRQDAVRSPRTESTTRPPVFPARRPSSPRPTRPSKVHDAARSASASERRDLSGAARRPARPRRRRALVDRSSEAALATPARGEHCEGCVTCPTRTRAT